MTTTEALEPIAQDYQNGMTYKAIAQKYQIDQRTAKRYVENNLPLSDLYHRPFSSILDPYKEQIDKWLLQGRIFSSVIYDWLSEEGFAGSYNIVNRYVQNRIRDYEETGVYPVDSSDKRIRSVDSPAIKARKEQQYVRDSNK